MQTTRPIANDTNLDRLRTAVVDAAYQMDILGKSVDVAAASMRQFAALVPDCAEE